MEQGAEAACKITWVGCLREREEESGVLLPLLSADIFTNMEREEGKEGREQGELLGCGVEGQNVKETSDGRCVGKWGKGFKCTDKGL